MPEWACVNGVCSPLDEATISINDRGLLFGDSVYEVLLAQGLLVIAAGRHFARLHRSLDAIGMTVDMPRLRSWIGQTIRQSQLDRSIIYVQVTRGTAPRQHVPPAGLTPNVIVTVREWAGLSEDVRVRGVGIITRPETRWARRDVKSTNLLPNTLAKTHAAGMGAFEALFVESDGTVNEASSSNIFAVSGRALVTPPLGPALLPGVTRDIVVELARDAGLEVAERRLALSELRRADEVFLTGTTAEVLGVTHVDGSAIAAGTVGPVTRLLWQSYVAAIERLSERVD